MTVVLIINKANFRWFSYASAGNRWDDSMQWHCFYKVQSVAPIIKWSCKMLNHFLNSCGCYQAVTFRYSLGYASVPSELSSLLFFLCWTCNLIGTVIQPHRVHCDEPLVRLTKTSLLHFGQFNSMPRTNDVVLGFINYPSETETYQELWAVEFVWVSVE